MESPYGEPLGAAQRESIANPRRQWFDPWRVPSTGADQLAGRGELEGPH